MLETRDYRGSLAVVFNVKTQELLGQGEVTDFDRRTMTITMRRAALAQQLESHVLITLFCPGALLEYRGTVHLTEMTSGKVTISLYKGKPLESRQAQRHAVNIAGVVDCYFFNGKRMEMTRPVEALVEDMSTSGLRMRCEGGFLNVGVCFELKIAPGGVPALLLARVVRVRELSEETAEYGCRFLTGEEELHPGLPEPADFAEPEEDSQEP